MSSRPIVSLKLSEDIVNKLSKHGYDFVDDLLSATNETLAKDLGITPREVEDILKQIQNPSAQRPGAPLTQSAAAIVSQIRKFSTRMPHLDNLLGGGLTRGHVLEISGPPGSPKDQIAIQIIASFLQANENVIFVDCQNMVSPSKLHQSLSAIQELSPNFLRALRYTKILDFVDMVAFLHSLHTLLDSMQEVTLLVLDSLSFPLQVLSNARNKAGVQDHIRQILTKLTASKNLTIVITSQLATRMLQVDGSCGSFHEGAKGILVPQLGTAYLPSGRTHRIMLSLDSPASGMIHVLPTEFQQSDTKSAQCVPFTITNGRITTERKTHRYLGKPALVDGDQ